MPTEAVTMEALPTEAMPTEVVTYAPTSPLNRELCTELNFPRGSRAPPSFGRRQRAFSPGPAATRTL
jgi:hypothetical protein